MTNKTLEASDTKWSEPKPYLSLDFARVITLTDKNHTRHHKAFSDSSLEIGIVKWLPSGAVQLTMEETTTIKAGVRRLTITSTMNRRQAVAMALFILGQDVV